MGLIAREGVSGRPDMAGVDVVVAKDMGRQMIHAVAFCRFDEVTRLHRLLNQDAALYSMAYDHFKEIAKDIGWGAVKAAARWHSMIGASNDL